MNSPSRGEWAGHGGIYGTKADEPIKRNFVSTTLPHVYFMLNFRNLPNLLDSNHHQSAFTVLCVLIACQIMGRYSRSGWSWQIFHKSNGWFVGFIYWYTKEMVSEMRSIHTRFVSYRLHRIHRLIPWMVISAPGKCSFEGGLIFFAQPSNCGWTWEE